MLFPFFEQQPYPCPDGAHFLLNQKLSSNILSFFHNLEISFFKMAGSKMLRMLKNLLGHLDTSPQIGSSEIFTLFTI